MFWYPSLDLCLDTILSRSSTGNSLDLMVWFLLRQYTVNCGTLHGQVDSQKFGYTFSFQSLDKSVC
jgi:hypothetical protein